MATSTPIGTAISVAIETMIRLPTIASASPPASPKSPRGWVKKSVLSDEAPLTIDRADHEPEHRHGRERGQRREHGEDPLDDPAPAETRRADGDVVGARRLAHEIAPRERSKRRTTACAATFVISEITSRIAAR